jgi:hypothetical protein
MMKIKLSVLWQGVTAFSKIFNTSYDDVKLSYSIAKIAKKVNSEIADINKQRQALLNKYGEKDEEGKLRFSRDGASCSLKNPKAFEDEWNSLMEVETDIDVWEIPAEAVGIAKLTPNNIAQIEDFLAPLSCENEKTNKAGKGENDV